MSIRTRRAELLHGWVQCVLDGQLEDARSRAEIIEESVFPLRITRSLDDAKRYVHEIYDGRENARYGLLASSKSERSLSPFGLDSGFQATRGTDYAAWYNRPVGDPKSCTAFTQVVTEFGCQGLELDLPIVCWASDFSWTSDGWHVVRGRPKFPLHDPDRIRRNVYRVLLTRGRDGLVVWAPPHPSLDATAEALRASGMREL